MDFNKIMSLLKDESNNLSPELPSAAQSETSNPFPGLDLSNISQNVIDQVRDEYLNKKSSEDKLKNATTITPEVLVTLGNMVKETDLIGVLKKCKARQDEKEREFFSHRESIKLKYNKQREAILTKELIGVKDPNGLKIVERELNQELHKMDLQVLKDMDKEARYLQQELVKLNVPLFKLSNNPSDIKLQQKVLFILNDMI